MGQVRVKIGSTGYSVPEAVVTVGWDTVLNYRRDGDTVNFEVLPKAEFTLICRALPDEWINANVDWDYLLAAATLCHDFQISIEQYCAAAWTEILAGVFNPKDWRINYDQKHITFKIRDISALKCLKDGYNIERNIYNVLPQIVVKPYQYLYVTTEEIQTTIPGDPCPPENTIPGFCFYDLDTQIETQQAEVCIYYYHAFQKEGTCDGATPVPPDDWNVWTLLSGGCPGTPLYWTCPEDARVPFEFRYGRTLEDVLEYLVGQTGCGLTVKSDFFGIAEDGTHPTNAAYTAALEYCQNLIIFQKSDIKRHDASNPSTFSAWTMKLKDLLDDLRTMFKVEWKITGTTFRLEHISYFASTAGADYTNEKYTRQLEYDKEKIPRFTRFQYRDKQCLAYFAGYPVEIYCGDGEAERKLTLFSCDIAFISDADNAEAIGDDGFVLLSTVLDGSVYRNVDNNRGLSWTELHQNFHRHDMAGAGKINDTDTTPLSIRKTRKQPEFTVRHCCDDTFDPANYITTSLGQGEIESAEWNMTQDLLTLEARY